LLAFVNAEVSAIEMPRHPSRKIALVLVVLDAVVVVSVSVEVAVVVSVPEEVDAVVDVRVTVVLLVVEEILAGEAVVVAVVVSVPEEVDAVVDVRVTVVLLVVEEILVGEVVMVAVVVSVPEETDDVVSELVAVVVDVVVVVSVRRKMGKMGPGTLVDPWSRTMAKPIVAEGAIRPSAYTEYQEEWQHSRSSADQSWCFLATVPTSSNFVPQSSTNHTL